MKQKDAELLVRASFGAMLVVPAYIYVKGIHTLTKRKKIQHENLILIGQAYVRLEQKMQDPTTTMSDLRNLYNEDHAFLEMMINRPKH